jgi:signal transduction histidine kinase
MASTAVFAPLLAAVTQAVQAGDSPAQRVALDRLRDELATTPDAHSTRGRWCIEEALYARNGGDYAASADWLQQARACFVACGDAQAEAGVLNNLAVDYQALGRVAEALALHMDSQARCESMGDTVGVARSRMNQGSILRHAGDYDGARHLYAEVLATFERLGEQRGLALALNSLGAVCLDLGDAPSAVRYFERSLELKRVHCAPGEWVSSLLNLGQAWMDQGDAAQAMVRYAEARTLADKVQDMRNLWAIELGVARALRSSGDWVGALRHCDAALAVAKRHGTTREQLEIEVWRADCLAASQTDNPHSQRAAIEVLTSALDAAVANGHRPLVAEIRRKLAVVTARVGDYQSAHHQLAALLDDKLVLQREAAERRLAVLTVRHQAREAQQQAEIERLRNARLRDTNQQLARLNSEKDLFLAVLAHDLRNPLGALRGLLGGLQQAEPDEGRRQLLAGMESSAATMLHTLNRLLDLSRAAHTSTPGDGAAQALDAVIQPAVPAYRARALAKGLQFDAQLAAGPELIGAAAHAVQRIVDNLVDNALKFSGAPGLVRLTTETIVGGVRLLVSDTGPGISPQVRTALFEPYATIGNRPTAGESSTGLGLAIVHQLVAATGGRLELTSPLTESGGSAFIVEWPSQGQSRTEPAPVCL